METVIEEREKNGRFKNFDDFLSRVSQPVLNKRCLEALILSGAFDSFGKSRSQLMAVYEIAVERINRDRKSKAKGQFSLFDSIELQGQDEIQYPDIREFNQETKLKYEKEACGVYISGHPLQDYMDKYADIPFTSDMLEPEETLEDGEIKYTYEVQDGTPVTCGGILTSIKKHTTKTDKKELAICVIEDIYGPMEVMFFPKSYARFRDMLKQDEMYTIIGKVSIRNDESPVILAENLIKWSEPAPVVEKTESKLCLKFNTQNEELFQQVSDILYNYRGESFVYSKCTARNQNFKMPNRVNITNHLINELIGLIGEENVVVVGDKK